MLDSVPHEECPICMEPSTYLYQCYQCNKTICMVCALQIKRTRTCYVCPFCRANELVPTRRPHIVTATDPDECIASCYMCSMFTLVTIGALLSCFT